MLCTSKWNVAEIKILEDIQHLQHSNSLAVGREFPNFKPPVGSRLWFYPFGVVFSKIFVGQKTSHFFHEVFYCFCNISFVERISSSLSNFFKRHSQLRIFEN